MLVAVPFFVFVTWILTKPTSIDAGCSISTKYPNGDLKEPQPLILRWKGSDISFLYPENKNRTLEIHTGDTIHLVCPGKDNYLKDEYWGDQVPATCVWDKTFRVKGENYDFRTLTCAKDPEDSTKYRKPPCCTCKHNPVEIGFKMGNDFIATIEICYNDETYETYYTKFRMTKHIGNFQRSYPRPQFKQGNFFHGINVNKLYTFRAQKETLAKILGSSDLVAGKLRESVQFLSRGHLAAKSDFIYGSQQRSTFWYVNAAPQWLSFNDGNWKLLETSIRDLVTNRKLDLDVYTGTHDIMTMKNIYGVQTRLYLYPERQVLPVPKYFWKVIYDPKSKKGTAFVGLNDPFIQSRYTNMFLCLDVTKEITWLKWDPNNVTAGISYACTINELRKKIPEIPDLYVTNLLK
ncbi:uncharacterized protein LOC105188409 [Harpegnathos saltator]|uniref:uncharacterized protein LOC105188409 n=1 Tax=Harpegnathos saltator TaxID=610380 RepID=UPI000DBEE08E|nr:uncharacterized protein LOC105188409 [Harpegnathos saltator]